ncbi:proton myo-inositol cotransporter [Elysia marginata]|uniref:Proton myo-inositol cotransporter n=1 Tax=Elysia marginata TaxID=1093978 RepID=A0AAV4I907_9GAST|nr:proton myo-inositol cotransporter [Elysia marginata]
MAPSAGSSNGQSRPRKLTGDNSDDEKMDLHLKLDDLNSRTQTPTFIFILTFFAALGGFLFGYDTGVISGAMILLRNSFSLSSVWQELIVSVTIAAAAIFALIGGFLNDRLGRRPVIMGASLLFTLGSIMMAVSKDKFALLAGRVVVGAGIGE